MKGDSYSEYNYTLNENGQQVAYGKQPKDYGTDVYVVKAVDFIQRGTKTGKPFFIYLAPYAPHSPYTPAPRHANLFADLKAPRIPNYDEADVSDKPDYIRTRSLLTQEQQDSIDKDYRQRAQALQAVDEGIEAIVITLKANEQLDNTYIFFASDNGYHLGNHRQLTGKVSPYEEEMRVTMIVRGPGVPAGVTLDHLTGNVDLAPTWADLAGAKTASFCDGRSLVPLLRPNPPALNQWRQAFSFEYGIDQVDKASEGETSDTDPSLLETQDQDEKDAAAAPPEKQKKLAVPPFRGIRLQTLSYVEYKTGEIELYDLKADPYELQNLASEVGPKFLKQLSDHLQALATCKADSCRTAEDAPFDLPARFTQTSTLSPHRFGVFLSRQDVAASSDFVDAAKELGVDWVRINVDLGVASPDYTRYLDTGINVILMISNQDPSNVVRTYGTPKEWPNAGFPFQSKEKYQQEISAFLQPATSYLAQGRQVWVQAENEVGDASVDSQTLFWRGTDEQYLVQLHALYEAVKAMNANIPVVLTSFASANLDALSNPGAPNHQRTLDHVTKLLTQGKYDAIDLHFYGCAADIPAKVKAVKDLLPAGKTIPWISTENGGPDFRCKTTPSSWKYDLAQFEQEQARQVPLRLAACAENGGSVCLWFSLFDIKSSSDIFNHLGLLDQDKTPPRKKSAYDAFKAFITQQK